MAAGVQFISAEQLKKAYCSVSNSSQENAEAFSPLPNEVKNNDDSSSQAGNQSPIEVKDSDGRSSRAGYQSPNEDDNGDIEDAEEKENRQNSSRGNGSEPARRGTEVSLQGFQLLDGAATLVASQLSLVVACQRCTNHAEVKAPSSRLISFSCAFCHAELLVRFNAGITHQFTSVVGFLDLDGCDPVDLVLADSQFLVGCLGCSKEMKIEVT